MSAAQCSTSKIAKIYLFSLSSLVFLSDVTIIPRLMIHLPLLNGLSSEMLRFFKGAAPPVFFEGLIRRQQAPGRAGFLRKQKRKGEKAAGVYEGAAPPVLIVRVKGLEPIRLAAPDPKSGLSTNSNTPAERNAKIVIFS